MTAYITRHLPQTLMRHHTKLLCRRVCWVLFAAAVAGCEQHDAGVVLPAPMPVVERTSNQGIVLRWDNYPAGASFPVYIGEQFASPDMRAPFTTLDSKRKVIYGLGVRRHYHFYWQEAPDKLRVIAER